MLIKDDFIQYAMDKIIDVFEDYMITTNTTIKEALQGFTLEDIKRLFIITFRKNYIKVDKDCNIINGNEVIKFNDFYKLLTR